MRINNNIKKNFYKILRKMFYIVNSKINSSCTQYKHDKKIFLENEAIYEQCSKHIPKNP